jgi:hypothetical protein
MLRLMGRLGYMRVCDMAAVGSERLAASFYSFIHDSALVPFASQISQVIGLILHITDLSLTSTFLRSSFSTLCLGIMRDALETGWSTQHID